MKRNQAQLSVHFVAFDVDAKVFDPVKKLGATVVGALDETQLNAQLSFILQKKILLEEEETVRVHVAPGIGDGTVMAAPLRGLGVHNFYLRLHIRVGFDAAT